MTAPRLEVDLTKVQHNARTLVERLAPLGISVTGVTKATLGSPEIASELLEAGVSGLGDSRIENLEALRRAGVTAPLTLVRSPMLSQAARVVRAADVSLNTELAVIHELDAQAQASGRTHQILLMVELGDLREGIVPGDLPGVVEAVLGLPGIVLRGIGTNLACQSGVSPDDANMAELSVLADAVEARFGRSVEVVSGGNSANLDWALGGGAVGLINDLRLGESILLGREPLHRRPLDGLHTDAFTLVAEVIEAKVKPSQPRGEIAQTAFGDPGPVADRGERERVLVAVGHQDVDPLGLVPPPGIEVLGASSDHLVLDPGPHRLAVGAEIRFQLTYGALVRAFTSPFVAAVLRRGVGAPVSSGGGPLSA